MGTDRLIYIRADGNQKIATGHLMRCLAIAQAFQSIGKQICFLVSDKESQALLQKFDRNHHFPVQILESASYDNLEQELPELLKILENASSNNPEQIFQRDMDSQHDMKDACSLVSSESTAKQSDRRPIFFLDSYFVTETYMQAIGEVTTLVYLDDLQLFDYPADLVINYDAIPDEDLPSYEQFYHSAKKTLLGASYAPLRRQFSQKKMPLRASCDNLLITTGGSDPYHFALKLISKFQEMDHPGFHGHFHLVIGSLNQDKELLYDLAKQLPFLTLHENVSDMASLMETCDFAISAAGTTLYELCAIGVPTISYSMADNQITAAKAFAKAEVIPYAGDIRKDTNEVLKEITSFILRIVSDSDYYKQLHLRMNQFVDGSGARRIAEEICKLAF